MENDFKAYAVLLIPEDKLNSKLLTAKINIYLIHGNQKYLFDIPHCTFYIALALDLQKVETKLQEIANNQLQIPINISDWQTFQEDKLAGGGTTIGIKITPEKPIQILQKKVVDLLNPLRQGHIHPRYKNTILSQPLAESNKIYGYPFVASSDNTPVLLPHISFCSFQNPEHATEFQNSNPIEKYSGNYKFTKLALYQLHEDDKIELIREFELKKD